MIDDTIMSAEIPGLLQAHFQHLHEGSGIAIDVIRERGYRSVLNGADLVKCFWQV
jgi:hypothetical protein